MNKPETSNQKAIPDAVPEQKTRMGKWKSRKLGNRVFFVMRILFLVIGLVFFVLFLFGRQVFGGDFADEVFGPGKNGWDILWDGIVGTWNSWLLTLIALAVASVFSMIFDFVIRVVTPKTRRSKTIVSLVRSLTHYAVVIVTAGVILSAWGVNVAGIVAGVGILALVIGLGCQSLVQDVVSGLFIVFDDYYAVGDTVIIDGFRGTVTYVGLRTTKLEDAGGNIKSINNSAISTVANLARLDSLAKAEIDASYNEDVRRVEAVIANNLEAIRKKIPAITEGPFYKGISQFADAGITYLVLAKCKEADRFQVQRDLNRELYLLFVENDILVPYNQLTINPADPTDRPAPTAADIKAAQKVTNENRGVGVTKKKQTNETFMKRISKTVKNAALESLEAKIDE